jgi:hypothetical protein
VHLSWTLTRPITGYVLQVKHKVRKLGLHEFPVSGAQSDRSRAIGRYNIAMNRA